MKIPIKIDLTKPPCWREQASNIADWDRWDRAWRKRLGWRAGLMVWEKTNTPGTRSLIARHWPHRLCWSWLVHVGKTRPVYDGTRWFFFTASRRYRFVELRLFRFKLHAAWQDSDWMAAIGPAYKPDAPTIYWKHHLEHAEPAGTA